MDDTQRTNDSESQVEVPAPEGIAALSALVPDVRTFDEQARASCEAAARRYHDAAKHLIALRGATSVDERQIERARLLVEAAKLAWFNTVVHYERVTARRGPHSDG